MIQLRSVKSRSVNNFWKSLRFAWAGEMIKREFIFFRNISDGYRNNDGKLSS